MKASDTISNLTGVYGLTSKGELGQYGSDNTFTIDTRLTQAFLKHNVNFLKSYLQNPEKQEYRLAIIYRAREAKVWGNETLLLEAEVTRNLYPVGGASSKELTAFQKKNRENSVYRGMEILLDYKNEMAPDAPVYCPVVFDSGATLNEYLSTLGRKEQEGDKDIPVLEVLNLAATIPIGKRNIQALLTLKEAIYKGIVKKSKRKTSRLQLLDDANRKWAHEADESDAYTDVDRRADRQVIIPEAGAYGDGNNFWEYPEETEIYQQLERWLELPPEPPDPEVMRSFVTFEGLDENQLMLLAEHSLLYRVQAGAPLLQQGKVDDWNLYLVEGTVNLLAADGVIKYIEGGTENARSPVSFLRPRKYTVSAHTRVAFIWVHDEALRQAIQGDAHKRRDVLR